MKKSLFFSFSLIGSIGFGVAVPLVIMALIGRYIDKAYDTSPKFLIGGIAFSTIIVFFNLRRIVRDATEKFKKLN